MKASRVFPMSLTMVLCLFGIRTEGSETIECQMTHRPDGLINADCSGHGYTSLPAHWDPNVVSIDFRHNKMATLEPNAMCALPSGLQVLNLDNNLLQTLRNDTFSCLTSLNTLILSENLLHTLEPDAFRGVSQLQHLSLAWNQLQYSAPDYHAALPAGVFAPLRSLLTLEIQHNHDEDTGDYTMGIFGDLVSLTYLSIDSFFHLHFGDDFARLSSIQTLDLSSNCCVG
jgi:Leucine-rich repeat (LRR) protein